MKHQLDFEKPILELQRKLDELEKHPQSHAMGEEIAAMKTKIAEMRRQVFAALGAWDRVKIARHPKRPFMLDYLALAFADFSELHGDRLYADDHALIGGLARLDGHKVLVIGTQKGRDTKENIRRNFGSALPEGYRKALRLMQLAEKFSLPVISLVDTPGAFPGIGAEERHIGEAIAVNLREMMLLQTPMIAAVIGEGGSGGALGIGVADRVLILENAYYSVISPEGCAAILWKERSAAAKAAEALKISAKDLLALGLVDEIVPESAGGAHNNPAETAAALKAALLRNLEDLKKLSSPDLLKLRYDKFRAHGRFTEKIETPATSPALASLAASLAPPIAAPEGKAPPAPSSMLSLPPGNSATSSPALQL
ncbi:MAG: acetyl-CoA carboxylase carboxyltransferase subunit alpha [Verrucomicrobiota bacterium]|jgi:acetyl-CoA carboxylase carboxyl transferase subunit alpha